MVRCWMGMIHAGCKSPGSDFLYSAKQQQRQSKRLSGTHRSPCPCVPLLRTAVPSLSLDWTSQDVIRFANSSLLQQKSLRHGYSALNGKTVRLTTSQRWHKRCKTSVSGCLASRLYKRSSITWQVLRSHHIT